MQTCLDEETIVAFVEGRLRAEAQPALDEHLDVCGVCNSIVTHLLTRTVDPGEPPADRRGADTRHPQSSSLSPATLFADKYVILDELGSGGMGRVYAALDTKLERKVALKLLADGGSTDGVARLLAEATLMARIAHPNIVTVFEAGTSQGEPFIAMELVEGQTLDRWRNAQRRRTDEVAAVMAAVARGIVAAHQAGIVHRDIKPANVLIDRHGRVIVTDFGVSVAPGPTRGGLAGTPGYMAPEQFLGGEVDSRTDVFAFSATLYEMLHGTPPFPGNTISQVRERVLSGAVAPPPERSKVPARLHQLVLRGLAVDPAARPSLAEMAKALAFDDRKRRRRAVLIASATVAIAAAIVAGSYIPATPERRCLAGADAIDGTWSETSRRAVAERFRALGQGALWPPYERRIDTVVGAWRASYNDACSSSFSGRQSAVVLDLRSACLDGRRAELDALVSSLRQASENQLVAAAGAPLPNVADCGTAGKATQKPLPTSIVERTKVAEVQEALAASKAASTLGDDAAAARHATSALKRARELGYEPLLSRALSRVGTIEGRRGRTEEGEIPAEKRHAHLVARFQEAAQLAARGGDEIALAAAFRSLMFEYLVGDRLDDARFWLEMTRAVLARLGDPPEERAAIEANAGWMYLSLNDRAKAREALDMSLRLARAHFGDRSPELAAPMNYICETEPDLEARIACYRKSLQFAIEVQGPEHPDLSTFYTNLARPLYQSRKTLRECCELHRRALAISDRHRPRDHHGSITQLSNLAACLRRDGQAEAARKAYQELFSRTTTLSWNRANARQGYAVFLERQGDVVGAERHYRLAIEDVEKLFEPTDRRVYSAHVHLASLLSSAKRWRDLLAEMDHVFRTFASAGVELPDPDAHLYKGEALLRLGKLREAENMFKTALEMHVVRKSRPAESAGAVLGLALVRREMGDREQARALLEKALAQRAPDDADPGERAGVAIELARTLAEERNAASRRRACDLAREAANGFLEDESYREQRAEASALQRRLCRR